MNKEQVADLVKRMMIIEDRVNNPYYIRDVKNKIVDAKDYAGNKIIEADKYVREKLWES